MICRIHTGWIVQTFALILAFRKMGMNVYVETTRESKQHVDYTRVLVYGYNEYSENSYIHRDEIFLSDNFTACN